MALENFRSLYGPTNNVGTRGTGGVDGGGDFDTLAFETGQGQIGAKSKYGPENYNSPMTGTDPLAPAPSKGSGMKG
tara:strand:+ start:82 stop:309 length:228 start_codon:yes stop_codon:yes gene_type:complete